MMLGTAAKCKFMGMNIEISPEYAKEGEWEGRTGKIRQDQLYIAAKQNFKQHVLRNEVQVIITDGPILLGHVYAKNVTNPLPSLPGLLDDLHNQYDNLNLFVRRSKMYMQKGRSQSEAEAREKDDEVHKMLLERNIPFEYIEYGEENIPLVIAKMDQRGWIRKWHEEKSYPA